MMTSAPTDRDPAQRLDAFALIFDSACNPLFGTVDEIDENHSRLVHERSSAVAIDDVQRLVALACPGKVDRLLQLRDLGCDDFRRQTLHGLR